MANNGPHIYPERIRTRSTSSKGAPRRSGAAGSATRHVNSSLFRPRPAMAAVGGSPPKAVFYRSLSGRDGLYPLAKAPLRRLLVLSFLSSELSVPVGSSGELDAWDTPRPRRPPGGGFSSRSSSGASAWSVRSGRTTRARGADRLRHRGPEG